MSQTQETGKERLGFESLTGPRAELAGRRGPLPWLAVLLLAAGFGGVVLFVLRGAAEAGRGMPPFSVYSDDRNGLAQTAALLRKLGFEPVAVTRPIHLTHHRGLLILVEPQTSATFLPAADHDDAVTNGLLNWIAKGNTLLLVGRRETSLHQALRVYLHHSAPAGEDAGQIVERIEFSGYTQDIDRLELEAGTTVEAKGPHVPLWWLGERLGAVFLKHGEGRVLIVPDASLLTHRGLGRLDNVMLLYHVAALEAVDGRVYFDEYHHGIRSGGGVWGYLRYHGQHWVLLHLLVFAGVAAWAVAVRLGPAAPTVTARRADAVDYASAVARIYQHAGVRHRLAEQLARDFLGRVTGHLHLKRSAPPAEILASWRTRYPADSAPRLEELLHGATELRHASESPAAIPERLLLTWSRAFDQFAAISLRQNFTAVRAPSR